MNDESIASDWWNLLRHSFNIHKDFYSISAQLVHLLSGTSRRSNTKFRGSISASRTKSSIDKYTTWFAVSSWGLDWSTREFKGSCPSDLLVCRKKFLGGGRLCTNLLLTRFSSCCKESWTSFWAWDPPFLSLAGQDAGIVPCGLAECNSFVIATISGFIQSRNRFFLQSFGNWGARDCSGTIGAARPLKKNEIMVTDSDCTPQEDKDMCAKDSRTVATNTDGITSAHCPLRVDWFRPVVVFYSPAFNVLSGLTASRRT